MGPERPTSWRDHAGWEQLYACARTATEHRAVVRAWVEAAGGWVGNGHAHLPHELPTCLTLVKAVVGVRWRVVRLPPRQGDLSLGRVAQPQSE